MMVLIMARKASKVGDISMENIQAQVWNWHLFMSTERYGPKKVINPAQI